MSLAEQALPDNLGILAIPVGSMIDSFIDETTSDFIRSPQFYELWEKTNTRAHSAFSRVFFDDGNEGVLSLSNGILAIDLTLFTDALSQKLEAKGFEIDTSNIDLPENMNSGQLPLFYSPELESIQSLIAAVGTVPVVFAVLAICSLAGALLASRGKRRTCSYLCLACFGTLLITHLVIVVAQNPLSTFVPAGGNSHQVFSVAYAVIFSSLFDAQKLFMLIFAIAALALFMAGPSLIAVNIRNSVKRLYVKIKLPFYSAKKNEDFDI